MRDAIIRPAFFDARWQPIARLTLNAGARAEDNANLEQKSCHAWALLMPCALRRALLAILGFAPPMDWASSSHGSINLSARTHATRAIQIYFPNRAGRYTQASNRSWPPTVYASQWIILTAAFATSVSFAGLSAPPPGCSQTEFTAEGAGTYFNTDLARSRGASLSTEARISRWLTASGNYTYDPTAYSPRRTHSIRRRFRAIDCCGVRKLRQSHAECGIQRMNWNVSGISPAAARTVTSGRRDHLKCRLMLSLISEGRTISVMASASMGASQI